MSIEAEYAQLQVPARLLFPHEIRSVHIPRIWPSMALSSPLSSPQVPGFRLIRRRRLRAILERSTEAHPMSSGIWSERFRYTIGYEQ